MMVVMVVFHDVAYVVVWVTVALTYVCAFFAHLVFVVEFSFGRGVLYVDAFGGFGGEEDVGKVVIVCVVVIFVWTFRELFCLDLV